MSNGQREQPSATPAERGCAILRADKMPNSETIETIPMVTGADGVIRVSGTRVTLDSILLAFNDGATPEEIAQQYPSVPLADIYHLIGRVLLGDYPSVPLADIYHLIGYHLRHAAEMEEYLRRRSRDSQELRQQNEARWSPGGVRQR